MKLKIYLLTGQSFYQTKVKRMVNKTIVLFMMISIIGLVVAGGCLQSGSNKIAEDTGNVSKIKISEYESTQELKKFSSAQEIREFLKASASAANYGRGVFKGQDIAVMATPSAVMPMATSAAGYESIPSQSGGTTDYSKTNIQVEGVDEADFVKNDGKYIYVLAQDKLVILDAFPASDAGIVSTIKIDGRPRDMFVNDNRLMVFTEDNNEVYVFPQYNYWPVPRYTPKTTALIYDISDRKKPGLVANYSINGNYFQSRMIGDYVYFIVKDSVYNYDNAIEIPAVRQGFVKVMQPDVYYFDNPEQDYVFHTIASINIKSQKVDAKSFMMGYSDNLYVSGDNIYITYRKNLPYIYYEKMQEERFYKVIIPLLPQDVQDKINAIKDSNLGYYEKWDKISSILEETYNRMDETQKKDYATKVEKAVEEYETKQAVERDRTVIQKIGIDNGNIEYKTKGEVPGSLLNQFSMDESNGYFRVATTTLLWTGGGSVQYNNVYVMDKDLGIAGKLEEIAPGELIYSTRFIGNRLYMVTFRRMDPLFVIDLSDPEKPKVLGKLKIPGFSDYLHPYDENHIIGVGKETADNEWGGVSIKGVKLSLFDVSDVENPKQLDKYEIGSAGTDSEALRDHKAFLFDKEKNLLVIPVREITEKERYDSRYGYFRQKVWQGAYVFGITPEDGFKLRGRISHLDDYEEPEFNWNSPNAVRRSLYMDDVLYTVSSKKILMNNLTNISEINRIELPFEKERFYEYGWR